MATSTPAETSSGSGDPAAEASPIQALPHDAIHNVLGRLDMRSALACSAACRILRDVCAAPPLPASLPPLRLLVLRHPRPAAAAAADLRAAHALDVARGRWLRLPLDAIPFLAPSSTPSPVAASPSLLLLWADAGAGAGTRSLVACNPLARSHRLLPPLGSAWSRHGTVLAAPAGAALVLTELAALAYSPAAHAWLKFSLNLPSKPRSPVLARATIFALCDVGSPWRSQWKLFSCPIASLGTAARPWSPLDRPDWGDVLDVLKRPRLVSGAGGERILMIGGLRSSFAVDAPCSTVLILRLDLRSMEWDEAGRMPLDMYKCFAGIAATAGPAGGNATITGGNNKVKVFGGDGMVWFSGKRVKGKLAMWEEDKGSGGGGGIWRWIEGVPGYGEGVYRGFVFDAGFTAMP